MPAATCFFCSLFVGSRVEGYIITDGTFNDVQGYKHLLSTILEKTSPIKSDHPTAHDRQLRLFLLQLKKKRNHPKK
jgi:hypothetical protein